MLVHFEDILERPLSRFLKRHFNLFDLVNDTGAVDGLVAELGKDIAGVINAALFNQPTGATLLALSCIMMDGSIPYRVGPNGVPA